MGHQEHNKVPNNADLKNSKDESTNNIEDGKIEENVTLNEVKKDINNTSQNKVKGE